MSANTHRVSQRLDDRSLIIVTIYLATSSIKSNADKLTGIKSKNNSHMIFLLIVNNYSKLPTKYLFCGLSFDF